MKILLHTCCAPCMVYPLEALSDNEIITFFYNPNIHPYEEFAKRKEWVQRLSTDNGIDNISYEYNPDVYLAQTAFNEDDRCNKCYDLRVFEAARVAAAKDMDAFTTTLLSSPHQKHEMIITAAEAASKKFQIPFSMKISGPVIKTAKR